MICTSDLTGLSSHQILADNSAQVQNPVRSDGFKFPSDSDGDMYSRVFECLSVRPPSDLTGLSSCQILMGNMYNSASV